MRLEILQVPDCPNVVVLERRLRRALVGQTTGIEVAHRVIDDERAAAASGMAGSPTLLVDGRDPFAAPGQQPSVSCRLYRNERGGVEGAPSVAALRAALGLGSRASGDRDQSSDTCCAPESEADSPAQSLNSTRLRAVPTDSAGKAAHNAILRAFAGHGGPPSMDELAFATAGFESSVTEILGRLHASDVIRLDTDGLIEVAYPFSTIPTRHRVRLAAGGVEVYAMCAVDALGIAFMLDTDTVIETCDPASGEPITVTLENGAPAAEPATAVVFVGAESGPGPSADTCCDYLNFFTDRTVAQAWADRHPHVVGAILDLRESSRLGHTIFGGLLDG